MSSLFPPEGLKRCILGDFITGDLSIIWVDYSCIDFGTSPVRLLMIKGLDLDLDLDFLPVIWWKLSFFDEFGEVGILWEFGDKCILVDVIILFLTVLTVTSYFLLELFSHNDSYVFPDSSCFFLTVLIVPSLLLTLKFSPPTKPLFYVLSLSQPDISPIAESKIELALSLTLLC